MRKLFAAAVLTLSFVSPASADLLLNVRAEAPTVSTLDTTYMMHNGSGVVMTQTFNGSIAHVDISYDKPRAGISATPGKLLFTGQYDGKRNWYNGVAYVFKKGCDAAPYPVTGTQSGPGIVLLGEPPLRDPNSCAIIGFVPMTRSSMDHDRRVRLVFEFEPEGD
jgi:hypothetical protein